MVNKPASLEETPQKVAKRAVNKSIDVANTKLEPIMENNTTKNDLDGKPLFLKHFITQEANGISVALYTARKFVI